MAILDLTDATGEGERDRETEREREKHPYRETNAYTHAYVRISTSLSIIYIHIRKHMCTAPQTLAPLPPKPLKLAPGTRSGVARIRVSLPAGARLLDSLVRVWRPQTCQTHVK